MEKILFVTDAIELNHKTLDFAAYLCSLTHSKLTGIFLENTEYETRSADTLQKEAVLAGNAVKGTSVRELKDTCCEHCIEQFKRACEVRGITGIVHRDRGNPSRDILMESRYADMMLVEVETSFENKGGSIPSRFVRDVLAEAECPVIIMPASFEGIERIIFTYDSLPSSVFAMKQFIHLFPQLSECPVSVVAIRGEKAISPEERYKLKEWLHNHYKNINFVEEEGNVRLGLLEQLLRTKNAFIVMGAYGRSRLSNLFNPSHATGVLKIISQPVFITHT